MCGICGAIGFEESPSLVKRMTPTMIHRGPDSSGSLNDGVISFGMRRLKIIDLDTGDQPIYNEDRSIGIIFNGEIYNFQELHAQLSRLGHRFHTLSDTEAIVHAYEEWGQDCPKHLGGMFAFAIWDRRNESQGANPATRRVFLARDRLGIKPLYLWQDGRRVLFASEVRTLLASGVVPRVLSAAGLYTYLLFGSVQEPLTMIQGVRSLAPGSWFQVEWRPDKTIVSSGTYWQPSADGDKDPNPGTVREWLTHAVTSHLISDVPLGAFLSGGLDSGTIVGLASEGQDKSLKTFTLGFETWPSDERKLAGLTARRWHTDHSLRILGPDEVVADSHKAIQAMDQPSIDGLNTWYVSREARRAGLTVALSGVGGDELFAGYPSFRAVPRLRKLPVGFAKLGTEDLLSRIPGSADARRKLGEFLDGRTLAGHPYFAIRGLFTQRQVQKLLVPQISSMLDAENQELRAWQTCVKASLQMATTFDSVGAVSWLEMSQYMRSTLLRDTDNMSMAHSLEVRVPFLDHLLVERILSVKADRKLSRQQSKPLLTNAIKGLLPPELNAIAKRTFTLPFQTWLRQGLAEDVGHQLESCWTANKPILNPEAALQVWRDFELGRTNWARPWSLYVLSHWVCSNL